MAARDWFESLLEDTKRARRIRLDIDELRARTAPRSNGMSASVHGGGDTDAVMRLAIVSAKVGDLEHALDRLERMVAERHRQAKAVLYGRSGSGGLARATCRLDADILYCHYLDSMGWVEIAGEVTMPQTRWPGKWCRQRAMRALARIDRLGMERLADS